MSGSQKISREQILACANTLLDSGRSGELTVEALARTLHMSRSTLYKFFESKEDILVALVDDVCVKTEREISATMVLPHPMAALSGMAALMGRHGRRLPRSALLEHGELPLASRVRLEQISGLCRDAIATIVSHGVEEGMFRCDDPHLLSVIYVASAEAVLLDAARHGADDYVEVLEKIPSLLLPALTAPERR